METPVNVRRPLAALRARRPLNRDTVAVVGDLLPLLDFGIVLAAAYVASGLYNAWVLPAAAVSDAAVGRAAFAAAVLAPLVLCDRLFVSFASGGQTAALVRCYLVRFPLFVGIVLALGWGARFLSALPPWLLVSWLLISLLGTALIRTLLVSLLRRLEAQGRLSERIAVVGEGPETQALIGQLEQQRPGRVVVAGPYADSGRPGSAPISDLLVRGRAEPFDWIVLSATPGGGDPATEERLLQQLKGLAVPVARHDPQGAVALVPPSGWRAALPVGVPAWLLTLLALPQPLWCALRDRWQRPSPPPLELVLDDADLDAAVAVAQRFGTHEFGYVVTPNVDHLIRLHEDPAFRRLYEDARHVLLDSRFLAHILQLSRGLRLRVCPGSDLTARLLGGATRHDDELVLIGGTSVQAYRLSQTHGFSALHHHNPPMGFIHQPVDLERCLQFIEQHSPFRYCLLAVGSPQQEEVASLLLARGRARGLALCIGGSVNFITGEERRAPLWLQRAGLEWLYRLWQSPRRLARRYLLRGPRVFALLLKTRIRVRPLRQAPIPLAWERHMFRLPSDQWSHSQSRNVRP